MSFTQEKKTNILHCDGCKKHCCLDFTLVEEEYFFPMIDGAVIYSFQDENDDTQSPLISKQSLSNKGIKDLYSQRVYVLDMARKIARLCDNYKQR